MTDTTEAVARAIYGTKGYCYGDDERIFQPFPYDEADDPIKQACRDEANAAIEALRPIHEADKLAAVMAERERCAKVAEDAKDEDEKYSFIEQ